MDDLLSTLSISGSGMKVQSYRLRVISQNIANADSLPQQPGQLPYRRKIITFKNELDKATGLDEVAVDRVTVDRSPFGKRYDPTHPAANAQGYVQTPNVNILVETMDMREAQRSYDANLNVIKSSKSMLMDTIDVLR